MIISKLYLIVIYGICNLPNLHYWLEHILDENQSQLISRPEIILNSFSVTGKIKEEIRGKTY